MGSGFLSAALIAAFLALPMAANASSVATTDGAVYPSSRPALTLTVKPGEVAVRAWPGSSEANGLSFAVPASLTGQLGVGLQMGADKNARSGIRLMVSTAPGGGAEWTLSGMSRGRAWKISREALPRLAAGDVVRMQMKVVTRPDGGGTGVALRVLVDGTSETRWRTYRSPRRFAATPRVVLVTQLTSGASVANLTVGDTKAAFPALSTLEQDTSADAHDNVPSAIVSPLAPTVTPLVAPTGSPTPSSNTPKLPPSPLTALPSSGTEQVSGTTGGNPPGTTLLALIDAANGLNWDGVQAPRVDSISVVPSTSTVGVGQPPGSIWRAEVKAGETYTDGRSRAEMYSRRAIPWSTPAASWPDPPGAKRWFTFSVLIPNSFTFARDGKWFDLAQWKGYRGGTPPIALEIKKDSFRLGGSRANDNMIPVEDLGRVQRGVWTRFTVGLSYATTSGQGWVEVYRDGNLVAPRSAVSTMDVVNGSADPIYFKQGIYRTLLWDVDHEVYFSNVEIRDERPANP